ncbi:TPM domain-containing protein [Labrys wisconsinensis]|uniref:Membrane protein n=1 Tax=Labrys wisconsinensis TaxID=425677 RepID=A0ABU0J1U5_9HYPH|nr:TPM domain-containing protein [Labrys wisconsinensis]MDQ0468214.1 putative membrane protein [Labrys wisconsinensis]
MTMLLSAADHDRIAGAIAAAEARTSGEVYCVAARQASSYRLVPLAWAALASLVVPALMALWGYAPHRWPLVGEPWWPGGATSDEVDLAVRTGLVVQVVIQVAVFALVWLATWPMRVRLIVTPRSLKREHAQTMAMHQFLTRGLQRTRERTGVLIFAALAEHEVAVVADEGIHAKVGPEVWDRAVAALVAAARDGRVGDGFVDAVTLCGAVLAEHFPPRPDDVNELPDRIVEL